MNFTKSAIKIAIVVHEFPVLSETFILNQITGLIERGYEVDIYSLQPVDTSKVHPDVQRYQLLARTHCALMPKKPHLRAIKGIKLLLSNFHKNPLVLLRSLNVFKYGRPATSLKLLYATVMLMDKQREYDILHCQFGDLGRLGIALRDIGVLKGKLIAHFRGYDISRYIQQLGDEVYKELFNTGDCFLSNCDYFKRQMLQLGCDEKKVFVYFSGIDCSKFFFSPRYPHPDGCIRIVTTARLVEYKGVEYGIRAVAKLAKVKPNIEYNIIGDGPLKKDLEQLIQELGVADIVKLRGRKQQQELIEILNKSHIFIAPSVTSKDGEQDAPVNVLKEAMAMGLPVISTQHGGIPELVEDGISGFLVPERDVDTMVEKLEYLIQNPEAWPNMGQAGRAYVEAHFDIHKLNDRLVEIYQGLLT